MARSRSLPIATIVSLQSRAMKKLAVLFIAAVMLGLSAAGFRPGLMYATILGALNIALVIILFAILDRAKAAPIRHLMINSNGIRIAQDEEFAKRLAAYMPDFEVYLQFDSFELEPLTVLRGADLRDVHRRAIDRLNRLGISTTLGALRRKRGRSARLRPSSGPPSG